MGSGGQHKPLKTGQREPVKAWFKVDFLANKSTDYFLVYYSKRLIILGRYDFDG
jgi:hypothetical protein